MIRANRIERVNNIIRQEISEMLQRRVKDPRLGGFVAITKVVSTSDLRRTTVYVSCYSTQKEQEKILDVLTAASGFFRNELAKCLKLRYVPELNFKWDNSIEKGAYLQELIDNVGEGV
jgi:ribosome-binding factor A